VNKYLYSKDATVTVLRRPGKNKCEGCGAVTALLMSDGERLCQKCVRRRQKVQPNRSSSYRG
jgi:hypothetical protein